MIGRLLLLLCFVTGSAQATIYTVIVEGLGGTTEYTEAFASQVEALHQASTGITAEQYISVFRSGQFAKQDVLSRLETLVSNMQDADTLLLYLVGHGSFDEREYKFNIAGPDISGSDLQTALGDEVTGYQLLVVTGSSSGALRSLLSAERRMLLLATRSGAERHATRFGEWFAKALSDEAADINKNNRISVTEAFDYAERKVADFYQDDGRLATEHPRVIGTGRQQLALARLGRAVPRAVVSDRVLAELSTQREAVSNQLTDLQQRREDMANAEYQQALLPLMLQLAELDEQIEARQDAINNED